MTASKKKQVRLKPRFRITVKGDIALGPGKVDLLEAIATHGSISAAARSLGLSYRRAWGMVDTMNHCFTQPLVEKVKGGTGGGGARLTASGKRTVQQYRSMELKALKAIQPQWKTLQKNLKKG